MLDKSNFTRIKRDVNGNSRYVVPFFMLITSKEKVEFNNSPLAADTINRRGETPLYAFVIAKAKAYGGKKYSTKDYAGGIVFQSSSLSETVQYLNIKLFGRA